MEVNSEPIFLKWEDETGFMNNSGKVILIFISILKQVLMGKTDIYGLV